LRLVFVTNGYPVGGSENQLIRVAGALAQAGAQLRVISVLPSEELEERLAGYGIDVISLKIRSPARSLTAMVSGYRVLRRNPADALVCFDYQSIMLGRLAGRIARFRPIISSIRNEHFGSRLRELLTRFTDQLGAVTVTNSELVAGSLLSRGIVAAGRLRVIPNGLDLAGYPEPAGRSGGPEGGGRPFRWLAAGRLVEQKDYPNLLHAWARCQPQAGKAMLTIAGDGPLLADLRQLVAELEVSDSVDFVGRTNALSTLMAASDALVLSSRWEGLPNVIMEAFASGIPVVATDVGGVRELVDDGENGHLAPPQDPAALSEAMIRLQGAPPGTRGEMGRRGRRLIELKYGLEQVTALWADLIVVEVARAR
jgi:glycosyltransferase involved in cell wall biosynthesis